MLQATRKPKVRAHFQDIDSQTSALHAVEDVLDQCHASQLIAQDAAVALEIQALNTLVTVVRAQWPLTDEFKSRINLGPVAAKNISDSNPGPAESLMTLDYALRNNGKGLPEAFAPSAVDDAVSTEVPAIASAR